MRRSSTATRRASSCAWISQKATKGPGHQPPGLEPIPWQNVPKKRGARACAALLSQRDAKDLESTNSRPHPKPTLFALRHLPGRSRVSRLLSGVVRERGSRSTLTTGVAVTPDEPTHDAIREDEPPYPSGHGADPTSTGNLAPPPAMHPVTLIFVWLLRVVAVLLGAWAAFWTFFAMNFRMEGSDELEWVKRVDLELGGAFALAVILFFLPERLKKPVQCLLILGTAALVWFCVSGFLISSHEWQHRVRSGL
jgi:hypothetical protein